MLTFYEQIDLVKKGIITNDDAIKILKISKSTYYRLKNKVSTTRWYSIDTNYTLKKLLEIQICMNLIAYFL